MKTELLTPSSLSEISAGRIVGFYGNPPRDILVEKSLEHEAPLVDLDVALGASDSGILPEAYCRVARTVMDNAVALKSILVEVVAATGNEKCDAGRYTAALLKRMGFSVTETVFESPGPDGRENDNIILCNALGPVKKRVVRIMRGIVEPLTDEEKAYWTKRQSNPSFGFWGTPPEPIGLLDLMPDNTHIFGWTRAVEAGRPDDVDLEMYVPDDLPVIFFSQGFCPKAQLARFLADKHGGLHVDVHDQLTGATVAKMEAFIKLS